MTRIEWDTPGDRTYEVGLDRGVLYVDNIACAWNGLTSIDDEADEKNVPVYIDNFKVRDIPSIGDFSGTLSAYTYPDEFMVCDGIQYIDSVLVDGQPPQTFSLSYRTLVGNDIEGVGFGYRIHVAYELTAVADTKSYETMSLSPEPIEFSWDISGVPQKVQGFRPTAHIIFDTRFLPEEFIRDIEDVLYGDDFNDPWLPTIQFFIEWIKNYGLLTIIDHGDGIWTAIDHGDYISVVDSTTFQIDAPSVVMLDSVTYEVSTIPMP